MIIVSLLLIGVAATLLLFGLWAPSTVLLSASIGASLLAAVVLVIGARRPVAVHDEFAVEWQPRHSDRTRAGRRAAADTRRALELLAGSGAPDRSPSADPADDDLVRGAPRQQNRDDPARAPAALGVGERGASLAAAARHLEAVAAAHRETAAARLHEAKTVTGSGADAGEDPDGLTSTVTIPQQVSDPGDRPDDPTVEDDGGPDDLDGYGASDGLEDRDVPGDGESPDDAYLADEPAVQEISEADAARVSTMSTEVLVVDGRPRYHLPGCVHLLGRDSEPLPVSEAVELGFSPCSLCEPDSALLAEARRV